MDQQTPKHYIAPTFRTLFPNSKFWNSKLPHQLKINKIIKEHTNEYNRNLIHNISGSNLSNEQHSLLCKGLNYIIAPDSTTKNDQVSISNLKERINKRIHFHKHPYNNTHPFRTKNTNWKAPPTNNKSITQFFENISKRKGEQHHKKQPLSTNQQEMLYTLNDLQSNKNLTIKPCDKSGGICIMNTHDYIHKINTE